LNATVGASVQPATRYTNIFGSPLMAHDWPDAEALNRELKPSILAHAAATPSAPAKTNVGGWHSEAGQLEFCGEAGRTLVRHMLDMGHEATARVLKEYGQPPRQMEWILHAWANVNGPGHFNRVHTHPGSTWSGTYYVDTGLAEGAPASDAAPLHIFDPCQGRANLFLPGLVPSSFTIRPQPGLMVIFPSYLAHMVFPQTGPNARISIAFNLRRDPFP
jgi:uncharacterized protein (TIGR02466 family)